MVSTTCSLLCGQHFKVNFKLRNKLLCLSFHFRGRLTQNSSKRGKKKSEKFVMYTHMWEGKYGIFFPAIPGKCFCKHTWRWQKVNSKNFYNVRGERILNTWKEKTCKSKPTRRRNFFKRGRNFFCFENPKQTKSTKKNSLCCRVHRLIRHWLNMTFGLMRPKAKVPILLHRQNIPRLKRHLTSCSQSPF